MMVFQKRVVTFLCVIIVISATSACTTPKGKGFVHHNSKSSTFAKDNTPKEQISNDYANYKPVLYWGSKSSNSDSQFDFENLQ